MVEKFPKTVFFIARHWILPRLSCNENTTAPELVFAGMKRSFSFLLYDSPFLCLLLSSMSRMLMNKSMIKYWITYKNKQHKYYTTDFVIGLNLLLGFGRWMLRFCLKSLAVSARQSKTRAVPPPFPPSSRAAQKMSMHVLRRALHRSWLNYLARRPWGSTCDSSGPILRNKPC